MRLGSIDTAAKVLIIAEIGNNHEGDAALAAEMIRLAARAGADAVKFQTIVPERLVSPELPERVRQLGRFQLSYEIYESLAAVAAREGVLFLSTPFDVESARFLDKLVPAYKIASGDNDFFPLLDVVAATGKPVILSTGLCDLAEVRAAQERLRQGWRARGVEGDLALLHCVSSYPTAPEDANLGFLRDLASLGETVGYSDHTLGVEAAVLAVALGARIIEKHFTISKTHSDFRDHQLSADPAELAELVRRTRLAETLLGDGAKRRLDCEEGVRGAARRSAVAGRDLPAGTVLALADLDWLRPGGGLSPARSEELVGRRLRRPLARGARLTLEDLD